MRIINNKLILVITILGALYGFGTFGLLNLLGIRTQFQFLYFSIILLLTFFIYEIKVSKNEFFLVLFFASLYGIGGVIRSNFFSYLPEAFLIFFLYYVLKLIHYDNLKFISKSIILSTIFLCTLVSIAYLIYYFNIEYLDKANINIYHSDVGSKSIYPSNFIDWMSFTSGDGFVIFDKISTRMKGYSNEPSSTVSHYFAPICFSFLLQKRQVFFSFFILLVNIVCITSFTTLIIIFFSLFFFLFFYLKKYFYIILILFSCLLFLIFRNTNLFDLFSYSNSIFGTTTDLFSRKIGDGIEDSSLSVRQVGILDGFLNLFKYPFGYSTQMLGAGSGLLYIVSSLTGYFGVTLFIIYIYMILYKIYDKSRYYKFNFYEALSVSFFTAILFVTLFISGYGWDKPIFLIFTALYYRLIDLRSYKSKCN